jgi:glycosyltransferase involved in cell wall biosynthesis
VHARDLGDDLAEEHVDRLDSVLAVSEWHRGLISGRHPALGDRIEVVGNGVELDLFHPSENDAPASEPKVLFTSQPERGLDVLLELLPEIRAQVADAELCWCYAPIYEGIAERPWVARHRSRIAELADQPGAVALGSLPKPELAELMRRSRVWAHPSWATPYSAFFDETSCIAAMEAQAVGLAVVASSYGALPETVRVGTLVDPEGAPGDPWRSRLLAAIVAGLTDPGVARAAGRQGPEAMASQGWDSVAASIASVIEGAEGR